MLPALYEEGDGYGADRYGTGGGGTDLYSMGYGAGDGYGVEVELYGGSGYGGGDRYGTAGYGVDALLYGGGGGYDAGGGYETGIGDPGLVATYAALLEDEAFDYWEWAADYLERSWADFVLWAPVEYPSRSVYGIDENVSDLQYT